MEIIMWSPKDNRKSKLAPEGGRAFYKPAEGVQISQERNWGEAMIKRVEVRPAQELLMECGCATELPATKYRKKELRSGSGDDNPKIKREEGTQSFCMDRGKWERGSLKKMMKRDKIRKYFQIQRR